MPAILFVCSVNRFRSVIAEVKFRQLLSVRQTLGSWTVGSAGTWAAAGLTPTLQARKYLESRGMDGSAIRSREVTRELLESANLAVVMTRSQGESLTIEFSKLKNKVFLLSELCGQGIFDVCDPMENPEISWQEVGDEICSLLAAGFDQICRKALQAEKRRLKKSGLKS